MALEEKVVTGGEDDAFDKAFDAAAVEGAKTVQEPKVEAKDEPKTEPKTEVKVEEKKTDDKKVEAVKEETAEEKTAREAAEAKAKADEETKARVDAEVKIRTEADARVQAAADAKAKAEADAKVAAEKKAADELAAKPYEPTEAEKAALKKLETEWPEQHAALQAQLNGTNKEIARQVREGLKGLATEVAAVVKPLADQVQADAEAKHVATIVAAHEDAEAIAPKVNDWIATQPSYLKDAYAKVMDAGSAKEIVDLFTRYKTEAGIVKPKVEVKEEKKGPTAEEIAAGAPVTTRRATPAASGGKNKEDWDGAFDEAAAAAGK